METDRSDCPDRDPDHTSWKQQPYLAGAEQPVFCCACCVLDPLPLYQMGEKMPGRYGEGSPFSCQGNVCRDASYVFVQAAGVGFGYVFLDGETGEDRSYKVEGNSVLAGMHTTAQNGENLEEISAFMTENKDRYEEKKLLLYGNIPGLCYYLDKPSAVYTSWADLDTNPLGRLEEELKTLTGRPLVIITPQLAAYFSGDRKAMEYWGTDIEGCKGDQKLSAILQFMREQDYRQVFANEAFAIYE